MLNNLNEKHKIIIAFILGIIIGSILFSRGVYTPINGKNGVVIVNKITGRACLIVHAECVKIEKTR